MLLKSILKYVAVVAPFAGAWIEIIICLFLLFRHLVAPFAGAWIEIRKKQKVGFSPTVAPFAGAWIEILRINNPPSRSGAWIEIAIDILADPGTLSLPSRERGLKF